MWVCVRGLRVGKAGGGEQGHNNVWVWKDRWTQIYQRSPTFTRRSKSATMARAVDLELAVIELPFFRRSISAKSNKSNPYKTLLYSSILRKINYKYKEQIKSNKKPNHTNKRGCNNIQK